MHKLRTFFHALKHSLFPINDYYIKIRKNTPFLFSFKYLVSLILTLSVLFVVIFPLRFFPIYQPTTFRNQIENVVNQFPEEAIITINESGNLVTNYARPIIIFSQFTKVPEKLIVIDPLATNDMIDDYDAYILFMRRKAVIKSFEGNIMLDYREGQPLTFNNQSLQNIKSVIT